MSNSYTDGSYLTKNPSWHAEDAPWKLTHILQALQAARLGTFSNVLDAGCGSGAIIKAWAGQAPQITFTGWDISPQAYALAMTQKPDNVRFVQAENPPPETFDLVMVIDVLEHLERYEDWFKQISLCAPVAVLHVPLDLSLRSYLFPGLLERERKSVGHIHFFTARTLLNFLQKNGCQILAAHYTNKYVERPPQLTRLKSRIGMMIRRLAHRLLPHAWSALLIGGYSLMIVVKFNRPDAK